MYQDEQNGLEQAASAAHNVHGAIKTGKAIASAAKGAAVGGPYGAVAGLALAAGQNGKKLLAGAIVVLMLPVLFVLLLPGLIFGGLTSSGASGQPILNDNTAISGHMDEIAAAVDGVLSEGIEDAKARIALDFAATDGDNYEIIEPFSVSSNTNSFIAQYCAAKEQSWADISLDDMLRILRGGKSHLYSYTRTSEIRVVEADDPDTEDVVETKEETWYIYSLFYNGEDYFSDHIFNLTHEQKTLASNYAFNLSLFLGDGMDQHTEFDGSTITSLGDVRFTDGATEVVYFNQLDQRYANKPYGTDNIGGYGCGPTSMSIVVSSLTSQIVDPVEMSKWAYEHGGWCKGQGSYHSLIPNAAKAWGLQVEGCTAREPQRILDALSSGKLIVAIMSPGHFTTGGHFIVLRGVKDGKILVADPASTSRSQRTWDLSIILNEASKRPGAGGPFGSSGHEKIKVVTNMSTKNKVAFNSPWKIGGELSSAAPLNTAEMAQLEKAFEIAESARDSFYRGFKQISRADAKRNQSAAQAVSAFLCDRFAEQYSHEDVVEAVAVSSSVLVPLTTQLENQQDYLVGGTLWLLDYLKAHCKSTQDYVSLLPEADESLDCAMPFVADLDHPISVITQIMTVLQGRKKKYHKVLGSLLALIDDATAAKLRQFL